MFECQYVVRFWMIFLANTTGWISDLDVNRGRHKLLVDRPNTCQIHRLMPRIQNGDHFSNPFEIALKHLLELVASTAALFYQDPVLIVREEAHEKITWANQALMKHVQSTLHLQSNSFAAGTTSMYFWSWKPQDFRDRTFCSVSGPGLEVPHFIGQNCTPQEKTPEEKNTREKTPWSSLSTIIHTITSSQTTLSSYRLYI